MNPQNPSFEFTAGVAGIYTDHLAAGIGALMPDLDETFPDSPIPRGHLEDGIIKDPNYDQLVVVKNEIVTRGANETILMGTEDDETFDERIARGLIVGAATMSIVKGAGFGQRGQLEDFVVRAEEQGA